MKGKCICMLYAHIFDGQRESASHSWSLIVFFCWTYCTHSAQYGDIRCSPSLCWNILHGFVPGATAASAAAATAAAADYFRAAKFKGFLWPTSKMRRLEIHWRLSGDSLNLGVFVLKLHILVICSVMMCDECDVPWCNWCNGFMYPECAVLQFDR